VGEIAYDKLNDLHSSLGGPKARDHWEDLGVSGRITLTRTLGR